jgi:isoleucyl-tRNA synthetase
MQLIKDELNVKEVEVIVGKGELMVELDKEITPELKAEGEARELIRQIQIKRKEIGCRLDQQVIVALPNIAAEFTDYIKRETLAKEIKKADVLTVTPV